MPEDGDTMKKYVALLIQLIIWSGFTMAQWLSGRDHFISKALLFLVFFYLAFLLARLIVKSNRATLYVTLTSLGMYGAIHFLLQAFFSQALSG